MNKVYRLVWNTSLGTWVCAAETVRARGKRGKIASGLLDMRRSPLCVRTPICWRAGALQLASLPLALTNLCGLAHAAQPPPNPTALPSGGQVVAGRTQMRQRGVGTLMIDQGSAPATIDWQSSNIVTAAAVNIVQPSSRAVAFSRVVGADTSQIFGKLSANGQAFLSKPNGVIFGRSVSIDVGVIGDIWGIRGIGRIGRNGDIDGGADSADCNVSPVGSNVSPAGANNSRAGTGPGMDQNGDTTLASEINANANANANPDISMREERLDRDTIVLRIPQATPTTPEPSAVRVALRRNRQRLRFRDPAAPASAGGPADRAARQSHPDHRQTAAQAASLPTRCSTRSSFADRQNRPLGDLPLQTLATVNGKTTVIAVLEWR